MRRFILIAGLVSLAFAGMAVAENTVVFELPKLTAPPNLDGTRGADEWAGALEIECSVSQILRDGAEFGWRNLEQQQSEISANQLVQNDDEDAALARTDADASGFIWQAWDDDGFYYIAEIRDNIHDVDSGPEEEPTNWWTRDSISLYVDLTNTREESECCEGPYTSMNIINFVGAPQNSSSVTITWERSIESARAPSQDPDIIEGFEYGYRFADDEFGGDADYAIEGSLPWEVLMRFNLPAAPTAGSSFGFSWILLDPDGNDGYGGQIQCWGWADNPFDYSTYLFVDTPAGPSGTAVESDSWGRIKSTFN